MKRIKFILLAITMLLAAPALLTSCQEDAPEINYTMNVSVINDFTKVVEAINNGSLKNEEAINRLTEAIDKMNADQQTKLQAIIDVLNSVNATLEAKLALIEGTMKAQTLSLETKLGLLEAAIKNLPDYSAQLEAIKTAIANLPDYGDKLSAIQAAIEALPDYSDKFDAVVEALGAIETQISALGGPLGDIATQIGNAVTAINNLIASVNSGNTDAAAALAQIIQKLEDIKTAIEAIEAGGGGGETPSPDKYVDLGLPSGLKWAKCNLGASKPSDYGDYYAWGETEPKAKYTWDNYKWGKEGNITKYNATDGKPTLDPADDVATQKLGNPWRMPTFDEIKELSDNCTWTWTTQGGVNGYEVKGLNDNIIFLPAAGIRSGSRLYNAGSWGFYWSGSLSTVRSDRAGGLIFDSDGHRRIDNDRYNGFTVRPVRP